MSLNVGELVAYLRMNTDDYDKKSSSREKHFAGMASSLASAAKSVALVGGGAVAAAGAVGVRTAAQMENARIGFTTMLGSAQQADTFLKQLSTFAASTPFEFPELQTAASSLVSAGVEAKNVIPIMTSLGNATSGMGTGSEGVKRATVALQQMNAAGRITGEDLNQLRDAGIPVYDLLASAMHKPKAEVADLAQKGKLGKQALDQMMAALENGKGLERFSGLMDAQSQSLNGLWSTLHDTFTMGMSTAIAPLVPLIKQGLGGAITGLTALMPKVAAGLGTITAYAQQAMTILFKGDFTHGPLAEDSAAVDRLFRLRDGLIQTGGIARQAWDILFHGDFTHGPLSEDGKMTDRLFRVREGLLHVKQAISDAFETKGGSIDWSATLAKVGDAAEKVWPMLVNTAESLKGLHPIMTVTGAVAKVLADHIDLIVQVMPLLLAAFVAYKAAQTASMIAEIVHLPVTIALAASNIAYANAVWALLAAQGIQRTSMIRSMALWVIHAAQMTYATVRVYAYVAGMYIQAAATQVVTAAQWLFNAALTANPIGLVIVAIAALVAGLVLLYTHSDTARKIIDAAFHGIAAAASYMWNDVIKPYFRFMAEAWLTVVGTILDGAVKAFGWVPGIGDKLKGAAKAFDGFRDDVNNALDGVKDKTISVEARASMITADRALGSVAGNLNPNVNGKATGGAISGPGSGTSDTAGLFPLSNGEHVLTASDVQKAGGHGAIYAMRASIQKGMATGGAVGLNVNTRADASPITSGLGSWYSGVVNSVTAAGQRQAAAQAAAYSGAMPTGDAVTRWAPLVSSVLAELGLNGGLVAKVLRQIKTESGGNPNATQGNIGDVNNKSGDLARGLMQVIGATFRAYAGPYRSLGQYDPHASIYAGLNYASHRYGPNLSALGNGHGYDSGGMAVGVGLMAKGTIRPERVLSPRQTESFERLVDMLGRTSGDGKPMNVHVYIGGEKLDERIAVRVDQENDRMASSVFAA